MSLLDDLGATLGPAGAAGDSALIRSVLAMLSQGGGLRGLVRAFEEKGLAGIIGSWIGRGENLPISADEVRRALGPDRLRELAARARVPVETSAGVLASVLPGLIDKLPPEGRIPDLLEKGLGFLRGQPG